jgi:hypothetical protein|tara:strand:- start:1160 stop:1351 length:192 start_codon:yes stop_codon:yes gene_type:complete
MKNLKETHHYEHHTGTAGNGETTYMVVLVRNENKAWDEIEHFTTKGEADAWTKFSTIPTKKDR